jgi:hypothetical protein
MCHNFCSPCIRTGHGYSTIQPEAFLHDCTSDTVQSNTCSDDHPDHFPSQSSNRSSWYLLSPHGDSAAHFNHSTVRAKAAKCRFVATHPFFGVRI